MIILFKQANEPDLNCYMPSFNMEMDGPVYSLSSEISEDLPAMTMSGEFGYLRLQADLPFMSLAAGSSFALTWESLNATLPSLELEQNAGGSLEALLPRLQAQGVLSPGSVFDIAAGFPVLELVSFSGGEVKAQLPSLSSIMESSSIFPGRIIASVPLFSMLIEGREEGQGLIEAGIPVLNFSLSAKTGGVLDMDAMLPSPSLMVSSKSGAVCLIAAALPIMGCRMRSIVTGENNIVAIISLVGMNAHTGEIEETVLRYEKGKIR